MADFSGSGAASGALSGAGIGTQIMPGWGTAIGAGIGGLTGGFGGGGKGKGSTPSAPDYHQAAVDQGYMNNPNVNTPWSTQQTTIDPNTGQATMNFGLTGGAGTALGNLQGSMANASSYDPAGARNQAIDSNYQQAASRLDPQWQQRDAALRSQMANSGLDPGTEAYNNAYGNESRSRNDAYTSAMNNAIGQGNQTQQTMMAQSMLPFQQYGSLISSSMQQPHYGGGGNLQTAAGQQGQAMNNQYSAGQANNAGMMSGLGSLAGQFGGGGGSGKGKNSGYTGANPYNPAAAGPGY